MSWENNTNTSPLQRHLYNGKELDTDFGLNVYFYGARLHDPALGRFTTLDPISDRFPWVSTYNYAENRPVNGIDLHGLQYVPFSSATFQMTGYDKEQHQRDVQGYLQGQKERGKEIIDEIPYVGEAKAASEGDVIGVLLAMIPGGSFFKKGKKLKDKIDDLPEVEFDEDAMPNIVQNIEEAFDSGVDDVLTRETSKSQIRKNRREALRGKTKEADDTSLDEFPFASSKEGGEGAHVKEVPVNEQHKQGGILSGFFRKNQIKDGDKFRVKIKKKDK